MTEGRLIPRDRTAHPAALDPDYKTSVARAPSLPLLSLDSTPTEETGPRFGHGHIGPYDHDLVVNWTRGAARAIGERIVVHGRVIDEMGCGLPHALVEVWQANAGGRYRHAKDGYLAPLDPNFGGAGRCLTDEAGAYAFFTIKPGAYERGSIIITSNLPFDEWTEVFGSERLTGAILDRLTHHVHILEMNGESFRLRQSRKTKA